MVVFLIVFPPALVAYLLFLRLCALRIDAKHTHQFFASPFEYFPITPWNLPSPDELTEKGRQLLPWFMVSVLLFVFAFLAAGIIFWSHVQ